MGTIVDRDHSSDMQSVLHMASSANCILSAVAFSRQISLLLYVPATAVRISDWSVPAAWHSAHRYNSLSMVPSSSIMGASQQGDRLPRCFQLYACGSASRDGIRWPAQLLLLNVAREAHSQPSLSHREGGGAARRSRAAVGCMY